MGSKCGTRTRARARKRERRSSRGPRRSERSGMPRVAPGFLLSPRTSSPLLFLFGLLGQVSLYLSLILSFSFSLSVSPLSYGNGLTLSLSPSHSRGEEPSIQFSPQPLGRAVSTTGTEINNLDEEVHSSNWLHSSR